MDTCLLENYDGSKLKNITFSPEGDVNSYKKEVYRYINNLWFAIKEQDSQDPLVWESSIDLLIDAIKAKIPSDHLNKPTIELSLESLRQEIKEEKIPEPSSLDLEYPLEIPSGGKDKKKNIEEKELRLYLNELFKGDRVLIMDFKENFKQNLYRLTVVDTSPKGKIVESDEDVSHNVANYLNYNYNLIYNFLKKAKPTLIEKAGKKLYTLKKDGTYTQNNSDLLDEFYKYIMSQYLDIDKFLYEQYENKLENKDHELLDAVYAYLNIVHFDSLILSNFGNYIYVNKDTPIIGRNEDGIIEYKYSFKRKNAQMSAGWETSDVRDGLNEIGNFTDSVMCSIPLDSATEVGFLNKNLTILSLQKLLYAIMYGDNKELKRALLKTLYNLKEGWREVLEIVHNMGNDNKKLIKSSLYKVFAGDTITQKGWKLTYVDLNNIESIYKYFFSKANGKEGIYYKYRKNFFDKGMLQSYDPISAVFGAVQSTTLANYIEVVYNKDTKSNEIRTKTRNNSYNEVHQLIRTIDASCLQISIPEDNFTYTTDTIGVGDFIVHLKPNSYSGILNLQQTGLIKSIDGIGSSKTLDSFFEKQLNDLLSIAGKERILNPELAKAEERGKYNQFLALLKYIDSLLTTEFSIDQLGLLTLRTLISISPLKNVLQLLYLNALRVSAAKHLNLELKKKDLLSNNLKYIEDHIDEFPRNGIFIQYKKLKESSYLTKYDDDYWFKGVLNVSTNTLFDDIIKARNIVLRIDLKSTTKNAENNSIPNISVYFTDAVKELYSHSKAEYANNNLMFSGNNANAILSTSIDLDIQTRYGETKTVDLFTPSELFYHSFINKFVLPMQNGIFVAQPVTYSDKKKFLNFPVLIDEIGAYKGKNVFIMDDNTHASIMLNSIGKYYNDVLKKVIKDYKDVFKLYDPIYSDDMKVISEVNRQLASLSETELINLVAKRSKELNRKITFIKDLHYRNIKVGNKELSTNELLPYIANGIFKDVSSLRNFLNAELANYINLLLDSYSLFPYNNEIEQLLKKSTKYPSTWKDSDGYLVLAYNNRARRPIRFGEKINKDDISSGKITINPLIKTYFYMSNTINNNIKLGLMGHELHHKIKELNPITEEVQKQTGLTDMTIPEMEDVKNKLLSVINLYNDYDDDYEVVLSDGTPTTVGELRNKYFKLENSLNEALYSLMSLALGALFKRTVALPGTMRLYNLGELEGITSTYNVAYIYDVKADVYDFSGNNGYKKNKDIEAHDGSAWIDPFTSILENNSLDDQEVGEVKKPIWDIDDPVYGARKLVKYAVNTITNNLMLKHFQSELSLFKLFKKMTDIQWEKGEIDLIDDCKIVSKNNFFAKYILKKSSLFYKNGNLHRLIINFLKDPSTGVYYTIERNVNDYGSPLDNKHIKVYHLFDSSSNHIRLEYDLERDKNEAEWLTTVLLPKLKEGYKRINSLFLLHSAMGGIFSESLSNNRELLYSESSNEAVARFMIYISKRTLNLQEKFKKSKEAIKNNNSKDILSSLTQEDFYLPLKYKLINCVINDSAGKCGAANLNPSSRYYNNEALDYVTVSTKKYGILLDSDHTADEGKVSEMTQVISALDATGLYHDEVYEIYNAVGLTISNGLQLELEALNATGEEGKNKLYDLIGKTIINNFSNSRGVAKVLINELEKVFNITSNHKFDRFKFPFSDATIYNKILLCLGTVLNSKGIKRSYSGLGMVMVPAYDIYQVWDIDGIPMLYEDVLNRALKYNDNKEEEELEKYNGDLIDFNRRIVDNYLNYKLPDTPLFELLPGLDITQLQNSLDIVPETVVRVSYSYKGKNYVSEPIKLNSLRSFYEFKFNTLKFLKDYLGIPTLIILRIDKVNKLPRNLAPNRTSFTYRDAELEHTINIFDSDIYRNLYKAINEDNQLEIKFWKSKIKDFLFNLDNNIYTVWDISRDEETGNIIEEQHTYPVIKKDVRLAETIMSNIHKSDFNIKDGDSLADILEKGYKYFRRKVTPPFDTKDYDIDLQIISENGKNNIYVSLNSLDNGNYSSTITRYRVKEKNVQKIENNSENSKIVNSVYYMKDNENLYEIGREIDVTDEIEFNNKERKFYYKKSKKEVEKERTLYIEGNKILEYIEFLSKKRITTAKGTKIERFDINQNNLKKVLLDGETLERKIAEIVKELLNTDSFLGVLPTYSVKPINYRLIRSIFLYLKNTESDENLRNYYKNLFENVFSFTKTAIDAAIRENNFIKLDVGNRVILNYNTLEKWGLLDIPLRNEDGGLKDAKKIIKDLKNAARKVKDERIKNEILEVVQKFEKSTLTYYNTAFLEEHAKRKFVNFQKSLKYISSRIPAQTLQSFMAMNCIGFNGVNTNYAAVTHFLTFLLGSDYDIDKSYMMGLGFDNSGKYYSWSALFDYTSLETLEASEYLPLSKGYEYSLSDDGLNITSYAEEVLKHEQHTPEYILAIAKLLKFIYKNYDSDEKKVNLKINLKNTDKYTILNILNKHESTVIGKNVKDEVLKNFISSHIHQISRALGNLADSYTPVEMDDLRGPARNTPKAKLVRSLTLYNPAMINIMQNLNMVGKLVTGIAANGLKALFMWRTGFLEALKRGDEEMVEFNLTLDSIKRDEEGNITKVTISALPDLNISDNDFYNNAMKLAPKIASDNIGSQYISAATDNAKELILACINAGNKMAKCHLYLMALGFDVTDIVKFMTSDAVTFIDRITDANIFMRYNLDINYAITAVISYLTEGGNLNLKGVPEALQEAYENHLNKIMRSKDYNKFLKDLLTLLKVLEGANEFSSFGKVLGINLGVPLTKEDLVGWKNSIKFILSNAEKKLKDDKKKWDPEKLKEYEITSEYDSVRGKNFDIDRWLKDPEYRKLVIEYYNKIKTSINIFYFMENLPHFKEMFLGIYILNEVDDRISSRGHLINTFSKRLRDMYPYAPDSYELKFGSVFNELYIELFITDRKFNIKTREDWLRFDNNFSLRPINSKELSMNNTYDISSFKYIMETYIIPLLKRGKLGIPNEEEIKKDSNIQAFLNGLVITEDNYIPFYKANLNMTLKDVDVATKLKYNKFLNGMKALLKYKWGNHSIADLFMLYNLVVNKNLYGSERLTEIFEDFIVNFENRSEKEDSVIVLYLKYLGNVDYYSYVNDYLELNVTLTDLLMKVAPIVSEASINKVKMSYPIVKTFTQEGIKYYENVGYNNYKLMPSLLSDISGELILETKSRLRNLLKFQFGLPYINYINAVVENLNSPKEGLFEGTLDSLIKSGIIHYTVRCE